MTYRQAFVIGCQCPALWRFSARGDYLRRHADGRQPLCGLGVLFLLAVPMMMGATVLDVYKSIGFEHGRCPDVRRRLRDGVYRGADCD